MNSQGVTPLDQVQDNQPCPSSDSPSGTPFLPIRLPSQPNNPSSLWVDGTGINFSEVPPAFIFQADRLLLSDLIVPLRDLKWTVNPSELLDFQHELSCLSFFFFISCLTNSLSDSSDLTELAIIRSPISLGAETDLPVHEGAPLRSGHLSCVRHLVLKTNTWCRGTWHLLASLLARDQLQHFTLHLPHPPLVSMLYIPPPGAYLSITTLHLEKIPTASPAAGVIKSMLESCTSLSELKMEDPAFEVYHDHIAPSLKILILVVENVKGLRMDRLMKLVHTAAHWDASPPRVPAWPDLAELVVMTQMATDGASAQLHQMDVWNTSAARVANHVTVIFEPVELSYEDWMLTRLR